MQYEDLVAVAAVALFERSLTEAGDQHRATIIETTVRLYECRRAGRLIVGPTQLVCPIFGRRRVTSSRLGREHTGWGQQPHLEEIATSWSPRQRSARAGSPRL